MVRSDEKEHLIFACDKQGFIDPNGSFEAADDKVSNSLFSFQFIWFKYTQYTYHSTTVPKEAQIQKAGTILYGGVYKKKRWKYC